MAALTTPPPPPRRRHAAAAAAGAAAGEWAVVSAGAWRVEAIGKHQLMRRTGLPARDLRALDPALSYPSSLMGRDRAVVVNLERVRAVITASEVLVPAPRAPAAGPLVGDLHARLSTASPRGGKALPFEFRALEVCLEFACKSLEHEVRSTIIIIIALSLSAKLFSIADTHAC